MSNNTTTTTTHNRAALRADAEFALICRNALTSDEQHEFDVRLAKAIARTVDSTGQDFDTVALQATADLGLQLRDALAEKIAG